MNKTELGLWGEEQAARFLRRKGYRIVQRNFRCRFGEIDVIARKGEILAFVEVKLRKNDAFAEAREFVTTAKQQRLMRSALVWMAAHACELQPRFDVVEIYAPQGMDTQRLDIRHWENAFS